MDLSIVLIARNISKSYGLTLANDDVSLAVNRGEIVGLLGENGAGKSTLLSILAGFLQPDSGCITVDGLPVTFASSADALSAGIGLVHQHLSLVPSFTLREQLELAGWTEESLPGTLAADFHGKEIIEQLSMGRRQRVEIARVLVARPKVLLLDEPTSILAPSEVAALFDLLRSLRDDGIAILIVTHKVREVMTLADRIVVMTAGKVSGSFERTSGAWDPDTSDEVLKRMFDWAPPNRNALPPVAAIESEARNAQDAHDSPALLQLVNVSTDSPEDGRPLNQITLDVLAGQIHIIAGVDGQGQTELGEAIAGHRNSTGTIALAGRAIEGMTAIERARLGIALLVDDRLGEGAIGSFSIAENVMLKRPRPRALTRHGLFRRANVLEYARLAIEEWGVEPPDPRARFGSLSGGNMQRVLAAREFGRDLDVLIALNPVQGLDVQTAEFLWRRFRELCVHGSAVLVFTTDLDEAVARADRCGVIHAGRVSPLLPVSQVSKRNYGSMMVNGW